jgi:hypothetical protein
MAPPVPAEPAAAGVVGGAARPRFEVADIVRVGGEQYLRTHPSTSAERRVLRALAHCRTATLGGHVEQCDACGHHRIAYNSCRNRHCPKCQGKERARWMAAEQALLLPVPYFHVVFTLPHALNALVRANRRRLHGMLFRVAAATLATFARDPRHLGAEPAITMVLHTWTQTLTEHHHVHCVVSGGGLSLDGRAWVALPAGTRTHRRPFLFPVRALAQVFRGKYLAALRRARQRGALTFAGASAPLADARRWQALLDALQRPAWVVYAKPPFGSPATVLKYLSRYTHRVAIANRRLLAVSEAGVRFTYRDPTDHHRTKAMGLPATEFLRRFLLHVVPRGFMRIRHYGLTANRHRAAKLARCRAVLTQPPPPPPAREPTPPPATPAPGHTGRPDAPAAAGCPVCGGPLRQLPLRAAGTGMPLPLAASLDTS